ncbi:MAG TPA: phage tail protein, partial [Roseiflexaceae bacterium]|nr:phage tail protein [Roseiflexaceae bacterium]
MSEGPKDSFLGAWFGVEFQGQITGAFRECSGLGSENEVVEDKQAMQNGKFAVKKIPGNLKINNITLKQGITDDMDMWKWRALVEQGKISEARKNGSLVLFSADGREI